MVFASTSFCDRCSQQTRAEKMYSLQGLRIGAGIRKRPCFGYGRAALGRGKGEKVVAVRFDIIGSLK